eukprot:571655-Rhodomonas_salina.1
MAAANISRAFSLQHDPVRCGLWALGDAPVLLPPGEVLCHCYGISAAIEFSDTDLCSCYEVSDTGVRTCYDTSGTDTACGTNPSAEMSRTLVPNARY